MLKKYLATAALVLVVAGIALAQSVNAPVGQRSLAAMSALYCKLTGCTMSGAIDMDGNDITIDADGTSRIELGTNDRFFLYINDVLRFGVGGSIYHYTASDLQGNYLFDSTSAAELGGDCNPATIPNSAGNMVTCNAHEIKGAAAFGSTINVAGEATLQGVSGDGSGKVTCVKATGDIGTCSSVVASDGTCTCG